MVPKVKLRCDVFRKMQDGFGLNDSQMARKMGIGRTQLWRATLPESDPRYASPGTQFIAGALNVFRDARFEDLFFLG